MSAWREHRGERWPYTGDEFVYLKLRCGHETKEPVCAGKFRWSHKDEPGDIVGWREAG